MDVHGILVWFAIWPVGASLCLHGTLSWFFRASSARCLCISNNSGVMRKTSAWRKTRMVGWGVLSPTNCNRQCGHIQVYIYIYKWGIVGYSMYMFLLGYVYVILCYTILLYTCIYHIREPPAIIDDCNIKKTRIEISKRTWGCLVTYNGCK